MRKSDIRDDNGNTLYEQKRKAKSLIRMVLVCVLVVLLVGAILLGIFIQKWKTDGVSFAIIGGADGPTSIFLAGKLGGSDAKEQSEEEAEVQTKEQMEEQAEMKAEVITTKQAKEIMNSGEECVILDVREADEYAEGHIEGAIQLSYTEIETRAEQVLADKDKLILVYCRSGRRSAIAAQALLELGYSNVKDFGGIIDWPYETVK